MLQLINAYRFRGHQQANLNPIKHKPMPRIAELEPGFHELTDADMSTVFETGSLAGVESATLGEIYQVLKKPIVAR